MEPEKTPLENQLSQPGYEDLVTQPAAVLDGPTAVLPDRQDPMLEVQRKRNRVITLAIVPFLIAFALVLIFTLRQYAVHHADSSAPVINEPSNTLNQAALPELDTAVSELEAPDSVRFNGEVILGGGIVFTPSAQPTTPSVGQVYYDVQSDQLRLYDGSLFRDIITSDSTQTICYVGANCGFLQAGDIANVTLPGPLSGITSFAANTVLLGNGSGTIGTSNAPAAGQLLVADATGKPQFVTITGSISISDSGVAGLNVNSVGASQLSASGVTAGTYGDAGNYPVFTVDADGRVTSASILALPGGGAGVGSVNGLTGALTLQGTSNQVGVVSGGSTITLSTPQDIATTSSPTFSGLTLASLTLGADTVSDLSGTGLTVSAGALQTTLGTTVDLTSEVTGTLPVGSGGTGAASHTAGGILIGNGSSAFTNSGVLTNGQLLIGDGSGAPTAATLTQGSGIAVSNGAGTITIAVDSTVCLTSGNCVGVGGTGDILQNGNSFTGTMTIGTNDNFDLSLETNGIARITISNAGNVSIANNASVDGNTALGNAVTDNITLTGAIQGTNALIFDGATDDTNEITFAITDPGSDFTITLPAASGTVCLTSGNCAGIGGVGDIINNGQNGTVRIGSNDANSTILESNGVDRLTITSGGAATFSGSLTVTGLTTLNGDLTVQTGDTFTFNGDAFTDLTGTGLTIVGGALQTTLGASVDLTSEITGILPIANGGTNAATAQGAINNISGLTTNGDLLYHNGTNVTRLARGSNTQCLLSNSTTIVWGTCTGDGVGVTTVGAFDSQSASANGAVISGSSIYLQSASASVPGLVNTGSQTFAGSKSFIGQSITFQNGVDNTDAFQVLNNNGDELLGVDTDNDTVAVGGVWAGQAFQVLAGNSVSVLNVDTNSQIVRIGSSNSFQGQLAFTTSANSNVATVRANNSLGANVTYELPNASAGTYSLCATTGNCAGIGGMGDILQNGNSFSGTMTIGTNDAQSLVLETSGTPRLTITSAGNATLAGTLTVTSTVTATDAAAQQINVTLGNDGDQDWVYGLAISPTSTNTGDADFLTAIYIQDVQNAQAGVGEIGLAFGTGYDAEIIFEDNNPDIVIQNAGTLGFNDMSGNPLVELTDQGTTGWLEVFGTLESQKYLLGADLSLIPIVGGQSALSSWWGLQLVGNMQSSVDYTPVDIGGAGDYGVLIPNQQAGSEALVIIGAASQSDNLLGFYTNTGTLLSGFNSSGALFLGDGSSNYATLAVQSTSGNYTYTIPTTTANDTFCLVTLANCGGGGGGSLFTDGGTQTYLTATTDELVVGSSSSYSAKLSVIGTSDQELLYLRANGTHSWSQPLVLAQTSAGSEIFRIQAQDHEDLFFGYQSGDALTSGTRNVGFGANTLGANTTGSYNTALGFSALAANVDSNSNVAVGDTTLDALTGGDGANTAIGHDALGAITTARYNTAVGASAMGGSFASGDFNVAVGSQIFYNNTGGSEGNVVLGWQVMNQGDGGDYNTGAGYQALYNTSGSHNVALGYQTLFDNTTGGDSIAIGGYALQQNETGASNIAIGGSAMQGSEGGLQNIAIGGESLQNNTANYNIAIGHRSLRDNATYGSNIALGPWALEQNATGASNIAIGENAMQLSEGGNNNIALGITALQLNTGERNVALGTGALQANTSGGYNIAIGSDALNDNLSGGSNVAIGAQALFLSTTASGNVAVGDGAARATDAGDNSAFGSAALYNNTSGAANTAIGSYALNNATTGWDNVALGANAGAGGSGSTTDKGTYIGTNSGAAVTSANNNTFVGFGSGSLVNTGDNNILFGYQAGNNITSGSSNIIIGYDLDASSASVSNELRIGSGSTVTLQADLSTMAATFNGALTVVGQTILNGAVALGDASGDNITFNGRVNSHIIPSVDDTYDLGSNTNRWRDLYLGPASLHIGESGDEGILSFNTTSNAFQFDHSLAIAADSYINFGTTLGVSGYGIRDNGGIIQVKDFGGNWVNLVDGLGGGGGVGGGVDSNGTIPNLESYTTYGNMSTQEVVLQIPAGTEDGDLLVAMISSSQDYNMACPDEYITGWQITRDFTYDFSRMCIYTHIASSDTPGSTRTWDIAWSDNRTMNGIMLRISGASQVAPIHAITDAGEWILSGGGGELYVPELTTFTSNTLGISFISAIGGFTSWVGDAPNWAAITDVADTDFILTRDLASATTYPDEDTGGENWSGGATGAIAMTLAIAPASANGFYAGQATFQDDFDDNSVNATKWDTITATGGTVTETSQRLNLNLTSSTGSTAELESDNGYDVRDRWAGAELVTAGNQSYETYGILALTDENDGSNYLGWILVQDDLQAFYDDGGGIETIFTTSYNSSVHKFFRIREYNGLTYWETSTDGDLWTTHHARSNVIDMSDLIMSLESVVWGSAGGSSTYVWDNAYIGTSDQTITFNPDGNIILDGGNSQGSNLTVGTLDNFNFSLLTGGHQAATFNYADGSALFHNASDSTTAFQVQNAAGTSMFTVDTANARVYIGNPSADAVGTLLVIDTKNTSGDPTGVAGGMYYNSNMGKFRCYENGIWKDCIGGDAYKISPADKVPTSSNAKDDEFDDASFDTGKWTWRNQGTSTVAENNQGKVSIDPQTTSGDDVRIIEQTAPGTPYAVTTKVGLSGMTSSAGIEGGLAFIDSASGEAITFGLNYNATSNDTRIIINRMSDVSNWSATQYEQAGANINASYLRMEDDGTNLKFYISADGIVWGQIYSEGRTAHLNNGPNRIALFALGDTGTDGKLVADWFRVNWTPDYVVGGGSSSSSVISGIGTLDSQSKNSNGATISSNTLVLQSADALNPGVVTTGTQTFAGAKTFTGTVAVTGTLTVSSNILPGSAGSLDLGSTSAEFNDLYVGDNNGLRLGLDQDVLFAYDEATDDRTELTGTGASLFIEDRLGLGVQLLTLTDDGTANDTLTPTATYVRVDADETGNGGVPVLTISESGAKDGDLLIIINNEQDGSNNNFTINNSSGVVHLPGGTNLTLSPNDSLTLIYMNDRWVTLATANN